MKTLFVNNEEYQAKMIIKTSDSIIGYNDDTEAFAFRGISDFSKFHLGEGQEWDVDPKTEKLSYLLELDFRLSIIELGV